MTSADPILDDAVDDVARRLRAYVSVARGVRAEFDPEQADLDPRVEESARELGFALGRFEDLFEAALGFVPEVGASWVGDDVPDTTDPVTADEFSLGMLVSVAEGTSPEALDAVLPVVDGAAARLVERLEDQGFVVSQFFVARGEDTGLRSDGDGGPDDVLDDDELDDDSPGAS